MDLSLFSWVMLVVGGSTNVRNCVLWNLRALVMSLYMVMFGCSAVASYLVSSSSDISLSGVASLPQLLKLLWKAGEVGPEFCLSLSFSSTKLVGHPRVSTLWYAMDSVSNYFSLVLTLFFHL